MTAPGSFRPRLPLTGPWRATLDPDDQGERLGYFRPAFDDATWKQVTVPASWDDVAPEVDRYRGVGWFRRAVTVPEAWRGQRVTLRCLGVNNQSQVWLNGQPIGQNLDAHLGFEIDLAPALRLGQPNQLALRIDNTRRRDTIPGVGLGWHPYGGILRELELEACDLRHLGALDIVAEPQAAGSGTYRVGVQVYNRSAAPFQGTLEIALLGPDQRPRATIEMPVTVAASDRERFQVQGELVEARPWFPDSPTLYTLHVTLRSDSETLDECAVRFGFRKIEVADGGLRLNGQPLFLTGFNRHEDSPTRGMCPDYDLLRRDLLAMKALGCNFIRLCHYPHHPAELDLCDELGLLAMDEIPLYWWRGKLDGEEVAARVLADANCQLTKLIRRDRNHPSVIFWSVSNECHTQLPGVSEAHAALIRRAQELDPTRLVLHVSDHWNRGLNRADRFDPDDVIGVNSYPDPATGAAYWAEELALLHARYPAKPILVTEFGEEDEKQVASLEAAFAGTQEPFVCGLTIWCLADHRWPVELTPYSHYGVYTRERVPKPGVEVARRGFAAARARFAASAAEHEPSP